MRIWECEVLGVFGKVSALWSFSIIFSGWKSLSLSIVYISFELVILALSKGFSSKKPKRLIESTWVGLPNMPNLRCCWLNRLRARFGTEKSNNIFWILLTQWCCSFLELGTQASGIFPSDTFECGERFKWTDAGKFQTQESNVCEAKL